MAVPHCIMLKPTSRGTRRDGRCDDGVWKGQGQGLTLNQNRSLGDILLPCVQQAEQTCILVPAWLQGRRWDEGEGRSRQTAYVSSLDENHASEIRTLQGHVMHYHGRKQVIMTWEYPICLIRQWRKGTGRTSMSGVRTSPRARSSSCNECRDETIVDLLVVWHQFSTSLSISMKNLAFPLAEDAAGLPVRR